MEKKYFMSEELHEILQNNSDKEYMEAEEGEDNEENNVQIQEKIYYEIEASALQREEDSEKEEIVAALCTTTRNAMGIQSISCYKKGNL
jgi:hypothetical protein